MKYKKYSEYKDSGIAWLGEIPNNWSENRIKFLGNSYGGLSGKAGKDFGQEDDERSKRFIPFTNIANNSFIEQDNLGYVIIEDKEEQNKVKKNDLFFLMSSEGYEDLGKSSLLELDLENTYLNSFCKGFRITDKTIYPRFLNYLLSGDVYRKLLYTQGNGFTRINLRLEKLNDLNLMLPPFQEQQQQIAKFLDNATEKIDTLITKQEKLIELLKEKRQAVISHAVTKGINPDVKMKDSGVEWLGEIPEHWGVGKLKHNLTLINQKVVIKKHRVIALENIESWSGKYVSTDSQYTGEDVAFKKGDILFGKLRPYLAKVFKCTFNGVAFGDLLVFRPNKNIDTIYSYYYMISEDFIKIVDSSTYGAKMPRASADFIQNMNMPILSINEQQEIATYLDDKTSKIDILIEKSNQSIKLLKEKRTALISAAVTGKIDVRGIEC